VLIEATATMTLAETPVLPNPVFEGSEKRVEIDFDWTHDSPASGLRALTRQQLDELMSLAGRWNCVACGVWCRYTRALLAQLQLAELQSAEVRGFLGV
jgi:hypothetical protein